ncbi:Kdo domain containing protein [Aquimarina brevivitae]|uniref:Lipopolysaccharide kinase (Kdo/WaaP) family protein n=1 Tax=Aquimarina brevivitae TaxID=323412 RepID=A0A4Q7PIU0_9FLAO|nr:Kdo domain containing protein [Aquimarina brevivitae]RZT00346.1 hypothetical protein EV197_1582 [Aquimarina brevivitae]
METRLIINPQYKHLKDEVSAILGGNKENSSDSILQSGRNLVTIHKLSDGTKVVVKSFKNPNFINTIAYRYFRKSKARRSFEYATILESKDIGTPDPIMYKENYSALGLKDSYYVSLLIDADLTYRELTTDFTIPDHEAILRAFTRFTYKLHTREVNFLDHSPGNTLILRKGNSDYDFFLVDLNRMVFGPMNFKTRVKNFAKLTIHKFMIEIMSNEYALCTGEDEDAVFRTMWYYTRKFQHKYYRKIRIKKTIFFWKKKYKDRVSKSPI